MPRFVYAALLLLSLIWGGSFYFIKMLVRDFEPWTVVFLRSGSGLVVITLIMLVLRKPFGFRGIPWPAMIAMATVNTAVPWALIASSEMRISSSMASILNATTPLWTIVVGLLFFRGKAGRNQWLGIAVASLGLLVLLGIAPGSSLAVDVVGFVFMLGASMCYAFGSQLSKRLLAGNTMYQMTFGTLLVCSVVSGSAAFATESIPLEQLAVPTNLLMILGLGAFGTGVAYILFYYIIQKGSPEFATMVTYLVPGTALIWGYALLDEQITWNLIAGLAVILAGVYVAGRRPRNAKGVGS